MSRPAVTCLSLAACLLTAAPAPAVIKAKIPLKDVLDRLAPGRKLVLFADPVGDGYAAFGFIEGTWFQLLGTKDGDAVRWAFLHCEPYFRRTFKGTTDELRTVVV